MSGELTKDEGVGPNQYRCAQCRGVFEKGWSDEEAAAEADDNFPGLMTADPGERAVVCDDCYKAMMGEA